MSLAPLAFTLTLAALGPRAQLDEAEYRADLTHLLEEWLPHNKALDDAQRERASALLKEARDGAASLDDGRFAATVMRVAALSGNAHDLSGFGLLGSLPRLPIRVWWFADGLFVVKASPEQADLLGARVDRFGALTSEEIMERARAFLSGPDPWQRHRSVELLTRLPLLSELGATRDPEEVAMMFTLPDGAVLRREMRAPAHPDPEDDTLQPWRESLHRPAGAGGLSAWPHVLDGLTPRPAYLRHGEGVHYERLEDAPAAYVRVSSMRNGSGDERLESRLLDVLEWLDRDRPSNLIVDLRYNTGGNFFNALSFAFGVGAMVPEGGRIFLLANRCTFSAAIVTMALIEHHAGAERVVVVGEPIGDVLRFWAEGGHVTLPASGILVTYNDGLHDMLDGCQPGEACWWGAAAFEHGVGDLDPDLRIEETFEDYVSGVDLHLEAVLDELR